MNEIQTIARLLAADEAALDYIPTRIVPKSGVSAEVIAGGKPLAANRNLTAGRN